MGWLTGQAQGVAGAAPGPLVGARGADEREQQPRAAAVNPLPFRPVKGYSPRMWIGPLAAPAYPDAEENP